MTAKKRYVAARTRLYLELRDAWNAGSRGFSAVISGVLMGVSRLARLIAAGLHLISATAEIGAEAVSGPWLEDVQLRQREVRCG